MNRDCRWSNPKWIEDHIERMVERQKRNWKKSRDETIKWARNRLATALLASSACANLAAFNPNLTEEAFACTATKNGWGVTKRGWPDFLCWKDGEIIFVEVKPEGVGLDPDQLLMAQKLSSVGLKCFRWSPVSGFVRL